MATATKSGWHSVSVVPGTSACKAAQELRGRRFMPLEAPRLPLGGCASQDHCTCKYQHHADRRGGPRRADDDEQSNSAKPPEKERRRPGERRERRR